MIKQQIAKVCPKPLTADELDKAAAYLDLHPDAVEIVGRLDVFDRQSRVCKGDPGVKAR